MNPAFPLSCPLLPSTPHKEDYETFKACMEEKEDRQDVIASSFEETQARLNDAEAGILALTEEVDTVDQAMQARRPVFGGGAPARTNDPPRPPRRCLKRTRTL